ncbi:MAG: SRPBCC family protein [Gemmatimonadota bacterium]|jgi:uncharacterized protein YndB with AHSA1/START domain|nr:SRPBCC family protein [Gemmatimonadota bacterium]
MRSCVGTVTVRATPSRLFALYADSAGWARWDPDIRAATLDGPFAVGSTGSISPKQGPTTTIRLTRVVPDRAFDAEARLPGCTMRFEHELEARGAETVVTHRVVFEGPMAWLFGRLIGAQIDKGMAGTLAGLKQAAEAA